jgi:hypothetical protein
MADNCEGYLGEFHRFLLGKGYVQQYDQIPWHLPNKPAEDTEEQRARYARACKNAAWKWVKSILADPAQLAQRLEAFQAEQERDNAPIRERLAVVDTQIAENRTQLDRLLDLHLLAGNFLKEALVERQKRIRATLDDLGKERDGLGLEPNGLYGDPQERPQPRARRHLRRHPPRYAAQQDPSVITVFPDTRFLRS